MAYTIVELKNLLAVKIPINIFNTAGAFIFLKEAHSFFGTRKGTVVLIYLIAQLTSFN